MSSGNNKIAKINKIKNTDTYKEEKHNQNEFENLDENFDENLDENLDEKNISKNGKDSYVLKELSE